MKKSATIYFVLCSMVLVAQQKPIDSLRKEQLSSQTSKSFFSDKDLALIDSLLLDAKFKSPLFDSIQYVLDISELKNPSTVNISTAVLKERLQKIDEKTPFHIAYNPALEKEIKSYLTYRKKYYPSLMAKAAYYFPMFEKYLEAYDVPLEMKYLAIVESTLNPRAISRAGARGLWQFMYLTGKQYGLKISSYVDERQDPIMSTVAACRYLSDLYTIFGDWDLALAAYNSGPGNVSKAIKRSGGYKNYWNIRPYLPRETAGYVPAFYATMYIFEYAKEHDLAPTGAPILHFETDTIYVKKTVSFDQINEVTGIEPDMLSFLNPSYKLDIIPFVQDKKYVLTIPKKATIDFLTKEKELYDLVVADAAKREKPLPQYFEMDKRILYKVQKGDYLGKIAKKFGVRVSDIKTWNRLKSVQLKIGQRLSVYPKRL
uniref:transglycosylase SLT domain-containing protein n=1 Tax=Polaribacter sp. TaxID=1920175 RepID=UPI0040471119